MLIREGTLSISSMMMSALSKKYKNKIWETGAGHYCLVLVESRHICIFMSNDKPNIFFERINFFYRQITRIFFFLWGFSFNNTDESQNSRGKGGDHLLFHYTTSTRSQGFFIHFTKLQTRVLIHGIFPKLCQGHINFVSTALLSIRF